MAKKMDGWERCGAMDCSLIGNFYRLDYGSLKGEGTNVKAIHR